MHADRRDLLKLAGGTVAVAAGGAAAGGAEPAKPEDLYPQAVLAGTVESVMEDEKRVFKTARGKGFEFKKKESLFVVKFAKELTSVPVVILTSHADQQAVCIMEVSRTGFTVYCTPHFFDRQGCGFSFVVFLV